jgi:hypothetical protein
VYIQDKAVSVPSLIWRAWFIQVVYILDQVRALEREMLKRIAAQGLAIVPRILVITRLIPDAEVRRRPSASGTFTQCMLAYPGVHAH